MFPHKAGGAHYGGPYGGHFFCFLGGRELPHGVDCGGGLQCTFRCAKQAANTVPKTVPNPFSGTTFGTLIFGHHTFSVLNRHTNLRAPSSGTTSFFPVTNFGHHSGHRFGHEYPKKFGQHPSARPRRVTICCFPSFFLASIFQKCNCWDFFFFVHVVFV